MNVIDEILKTADGAMLVRDWLGKDAVTVSRSLAEQRSVACTMGDNGKRCHLNVEPGWWDRIKNMIAETIRRQLAIKNKMELKVTREDELFMCRGCGCCLKLKVWVPLEHIKSHTSAKQLKSMPSWCWIRMEIEHGDT